MDVLVTCSGVVIGAATLEPAEGLAHATLHRYPGFEIAREPAEELGRLLLHRTYWPTSSGDFAGHLAGLWTGGRLALEDLMGRELGVNNIAVIALRMRLGTGLCVVADFRPDMARVEAFLRSLDPAGGGRTRPAA